MPALPGVLEGQISHVIIQKITGFAIHWDIIMRICFGRSL